MAWNQMMPGVYEGVAEPLKQISDDGTAAKRWRLLLYRLGLPEGAAVNDVIEQITVTTLMQVKGEVDVWLSQVRKEAGA